MEATQPVPDDRRRVVRRRKVLAVVVAAAVVVGGFAAWELLRPRTIAEVLSMDPLPLGGEVRLRGTITGIGSEDSTYGPRVYLQLDRHAACGGTEPWSGDLFAGPDVAYGIGDSYETTLRFEAYSLNGDSAVWSPALACPFPSRHRDIAFVLDGISDVRGAVLRYNGSDAGGWSQYQIATEGSASPDAIPAVLLKALPIPGGRRIDSGPDWEAASSRFFGTVSGALGPDTSDFSVADAMASLAEPASTNGLFRFIDANANGMVDSDDRIDVRLRTGSTNAWDAYVLRFGDWSASPSPTLAAVRMILVGPEGPWGTLPTG